MKFFVEVRIRARLLLMLVGLAAMPLTTLAQTDEIQVYDAEIAEPGVFNLMIHSNFTPIGRTAPEFPGAIVANDFFQRCRGVGVRCEALV